MRECARDTGGAALCVHILPAQGEELAQPRARGQRDDVERSEPTTCRSFDERAGLLAAQGPHLLSVVNVKELGRSASAVVG
ncbi:MAG: hypothetical protein ACRDF0_01430, partial [Candidatus Limnocylindria bacterium]